MTLNRLLTTIALVLVLVLNPAGRTVEAAEGVSSHYLPGANVDIFLALPPEPGFVWTPKLGDGQMTVLCKWIDFDAQNRFESDYITLTGAWKW
jgi:hypothetical protein